jgi:hypothetical protein
MFQKQEQVGFGAKTVKFIEHGFSFAWGKMKIGQVVAKDKG